MTIETITNARLLYGQRLRSFCAKLIGALLLTMVASVPFWAQGITVCYDYAYWRATGACPQGHYLGPDGVLKMKGFHSQYYSNPMDAQGYLTPGSVLVTSDGHAGYVNSGGGIDHFHQVFGHSGTRYLDPNNLPPWTPGQVGGLHTGDTLPGFLGSGYRKSDNQGLHVVRPDHPSSSSSGSWGCGRSRR